MNRREWDRDWIESNRIELNIVAQCSRAYRPNERLMCVCPYSQNVSHNRDTHGYISQSRHNTEHLTRAHTDYYDDYYERENLKIENFWLVEFSQWVNVCVCVCGYENAVANFRILGNERRRENGTKTCTSELKYAFTHIHPKQSKTNENSMRIFDHTREKRDEMKWEKKKNRYQHEQILCVFFLHMFSSLINRRCRYSHLLPSCSVWCVCACFFLLLILSVSASPCRRALCM